MVSQSLKNKLISYIGKITFISNKKIIDKNLKRSYLFFITKKEENITQKTIKSKTNSIQIILEFINKKDLFLL
jgi:hypothetical protein